VGFSHCFMKRPQRNQDRSYHEVLLEDLLEERQLNRILNPVTIAMLTRSCLTEYTQASPRATSSANVVVV